MKAKLIKNIVEPADGDHPEIRWGESGEIVEIEKSNGLFDYTVLGEHKQYGVFESEVEIIYE